MLSWDDSSARKSIVSPSNLRAICSKALAAIEGVSVKTKDYGDGFEEWAGFLRELRGRVRVEAWCVGENVLLSFARRRGDIQ